MDRFQTHDVPETGPVYTGNFLANADELTVNGFRTVMEIDAVGTFNVSRAAFAELKKSGNARIINISATLHYGATWYQVRGVTLASTKTGTLAAPSSLLTSEQVEQR